MADFCIYCGKPLQNGVCTCAEFQTAQQQQMAAQQQILVEGRIQNRSWDDQNGQKRYATDFIIENAYFADSRRDQTMTNEELPSSSMDGEFITVDDTDDLPF